MKIKFQNLIPTVLLFIVGATLSGLVVYAYMQSMVNKGLIDSMCRLQVQVYALSKNQQTSEEQYRILGGLLPVPPMDDRYTVVFASDELEFVVLRGTSALSCSTVYRRPPIANPEHGAVSDGDIIFYDSGVNRWVAEKPLLPMVEIAEPEK